MKLGLLLFLTLLSLSSFASPLDQVITVKDRLRIHLWNNGISVKKAIPVANQKQILPEEIERPLRKLEI
jgi:hypothetical protein